MNSLPPSHRASALSSHIRQERDVIATCVHLLGYWPSSSFVLLAVDSYGAGPLIRVDLPATEEIDIEDYLSIPFGAVPYPEGKQEHGRRAFALIFGEHVSSCPEVPPSSPTQPVTESDRTLFNLAERYLDPLRGMSERYVVEVLDFVVVGHSTYWSLHPVSGQLEPVGWAQEILTSPVYVELISRGSVVLESAEDASETKRWKFLEGEVPDDKTLWLALAELSGEQYLARKQELKPLELFQAEAELRVWDQIINATVNLLANLPEGQTAGSALSSQICALIPPDVAGYLVASLNNSATLHYLVYLACTDIGYTSEALGMLDQHIPSFLSDAGQSDRRILPEQETLLMLGLGNLPETYGEGSSRDISDDAGAHFAGMLSGSLTSPPCWERIEALGYLCATLENIASNKSEAMCIAAQSWVKWLTGSSTDAAYILESADQKYLESSPILLRSLLESSAMPLWLLEPEGRPYFR